MEGEDIYGYHGEFVLDRGDLEYLGDASAHDEDADDRVDPTDRNEISEQQ